MSLISQYTGMGAIVLFCTEVGDAELEGSVPLSGDLNSDFLNEEYTTENSITTTWVSVYSMCYSTIYQEFSHFFWFIGREYSPIQLVTSQLGQVKSLTSLLCLI